MSQEIIQKYFPNLDGKASERLNKLEGLYREWNAAINVISRKDMDHFYERHVLHSLALVRFLDGRQVKKVLDVGTGGGFPGIPLAIMFPHIQFTLVDSIGKKIRVVSDIAEKLALENVNAVWARAESVEGKFDLIVTRAVAPLPQLLQWTRTKSNRMLALKGGDISDELKAVAGIRCSVTAHRIFEAIPEPYFETKLVIECSW